jgi:hypothetical protein
MKTAKVETAEGKATQLDASSSSQKTGGKKQKQTTMSNKAGLVFPINRVRKSLQKGLVLNMNISPNNNISQATTTARRWARLRASTCPPFSSIFLPKSLNWPGMQVAT